MTVKTYYLYEAHGVEGEEIQVTNREETIIYNDIEFHPERKAVANPEGFQIKRGDYFPSDIEEYTIVEITIDDDTGLITEVRRKTIKTE